MKVVLIGFMGVGKTTLGTLLSERLALLHIDMDKQILERSGRNSIADIFDIDGEETYRWLEAKVSASLENSDGCVISCGGGVISNELNMLSLRKKAIVCFLRASFDTIRKRIGTNTEAERPLFRVESEAEKLFVLRSSLYHQYATELVDTDGLTALEVCETIVDRISRKKYSD